MKKDTKKTKILFIFFKFKKLLIIVQPATYTFFSHCLQTTWWHIGEVAASQMFGRGSNFQIRTAFQAGLLPLSCQYAR